MVDPLRSWGKRRCSTFGDGASIRHKVVRHRPAAAPSALAHRKDKLVSKLPHQTFPALCNTHGPQKES
jgi:hypothetical protein